MTQKAAVAPKSNAVKQADGKTIVYPMDRGVFDIFTDGEGWADSWSRYRKVRDRFYIVAGARLAPAFVAGLKFK